MALTHTFPRTLLCALVAAGASWPAGARAAEPPGPARGAGRELDAPVAIVAVGDAPDGPSPELIDLVHQLRTACRERSAAVLGGRELRDRLGASGVPPLPELERAYAAAQAAFQADELEPALRLLHGLLADLDRAAPGAAAHELSLRTWVRVAQAERAAGRRDAMVAAIQHALALAPDLAPDPDQYAPSFRRDFEEVRRSFATVPRRELAILAPPGGLVAFVDGKEVGPVPARVRLPPGRYRVRAALPRGGPAEGAEVRTPDLLVELGDADREVVLDAAPARALRLDAGPGLAVVEAERIETAVALGRWVGAGRVVTAGLVRDGEGRFLAASVHDVASGRALRAGRARIGGASVQAALVGALASYLLGGDAPAPGPGVARVGSTLVLGEARAVRKPPAGWLRPASYGAGVLALGAGLVAVLQARAAGDAYAEAGALVRADGALLPGVDRARYDGKVAAGDAARRTAWVAGAGAAALAVTAGALGYLSLDARGAPVVGFRF